MPAVQRGMSMTAKEEAAVKITRRVLIWLAVCMFMAAVPAVEAGAATYVISFRPNGGSGGPEEIVKATNADPYTFMISYTKPQRSGYAFLGWNTRSDGSGTDYRCGSMMSVYSYSNRVTLYARWRKGNAFTLHYYPNGGSNPPAETVMVSSKTSGVQARVSSVKPVREGYTFLGWNTQKDGQGSSYKAGGAVSFSKPGERKLYARWKKKRTYSLVFRGNGGTGSPAAVKKVSSNDSVTLTIPKSPVPTRKGYKFLYWNTEPDGTGRNFSPGKTVTRRASDPSLTLYARWTSEKAVTYSLTFNANGGKGRPDKVTKRSASKTVKLDIPASPIPVREGYEFLYWNSEPDGTGANFSPGGTVTRKASAPSLTLYARWKKKPVINYGLRFDANGGRGTPEKVTLRSVDQTVKLVIPASPVPVREGYTFLYWNSEPDGTGANFAPGRAVTRTAADPVLTLYARWQKKPVYSYSLTFSANGGKGAPSRVTMRSTDKTVKLWIPSSPIPVREGYEFLYWNSEPDGTGANFTPGHSVTRRSSNPTLTLYARWKAKPVVTYRLLFDPNGGTGAPDAVKMRSADRSVRLQIPSSPVPVREGYTFLYWNSEPDGTGANFSPGVTVARTSSDPTLMLYAKWKRKPVYTYRLTLDGNGGTAEETVITKQSTADRYGITIPEQDPERKGYTFRGWNVLKNGSGTEYYGGSKYVLSRADPEATLYAQWIRDPAEGVILPEPEPDGAVNGFRKVSRYCVDAAGGWIRDGNYVSDPEEGAENPDTAVPYRTIDGTDYLDAAFFGEAPAALRDAGTLLNLDVLCGEIHEKLGISRFGALPEEGDAASPDMPLAEYISKKVLRDPLRWYLSAYGVNRLRQFRTAEAFYERYLEIARPGAVRIGGRTLTDEQNRMIFSLTAAQLDSQYGCWEYALYGNTLTDYEPGSGRTRAVGCLACGSFAGEGAVVCGEEDVWVRDGGAVPEN